MNRYFIKLAYNGSHYHGWQIQDNSITVQSILNKALSLILREQIMLTGCGRTDAGVHALKFYAHFDSEKEIHKSECNTFTKKLNSFIPDDIVIYEIFRVADNAHARFDAISREYKYYINTYKNPFQNGLSFFYNGTLNIDQMNEACNILKSYSDFTSFSKLHTQVKTNNCRITKAIWKKSGEQIIFTIKADRFLRNMVRAIVGTMIDIGRGKINNSDFKKIIESKNRGNAGVSAPAEGLFLTEIKYKTSILKK